jgi:2-dehydro-3-deoxygalactonokinase
LLDRTGSVLAERRSSEGMQSARTLGFANVLERTLSELGAPHDLPVIICGMAGARQGWVEAPYANVPCKLDDIFSNSVSVPGIERMVRIVPGLAQRREEAADVMRGEETQLAGAASSLSAGRNIVCMPGTHSKWAAMEDGTVTGFTTWMTGELFDVFAKHTILIHSIGEAVKCASAAGAGFLRGVQLGLEGTAGVTSQAFGIRAATLLHDLASEEAACRLSGLLIGVEIAGARRRYDPDLDRVTLVASGALHTLYSAALNEAGFSVTEIDADQAVRAGLIQAARVNGMLPESA